MSEEGQLKAAFRNALRGFTLDVAFEAPARGVTALFGPSGCGKTTVLRCIAGLTRVKEGFFSIDGEVWQDAQGKFLPTYRRPLGYVFQEASLFPHLSVRRNLLFGSPSWPFPEDARIDFDEVVDLFGIGALLDRSPRNLSGGERQRVAIGRALLTQPKLLLMDEPLSALDRQVKQEILPFIEKLRDTLALPIIYITHDMSEVERLADHIVLMDKGHITAHGPLADLQSDPASPLAASREAAVTLRGEVMAQDSRFGLSHIAVSGGVLIAPPPAVAIGERRRLRIRASDVSLAREPPPRSSILNVLVGRIVGLRALDRYETIAAVALGENGEGARILCRMSLKSWTELQFAQGQKVYAQIKYVSLGAGRGEAEF